MKKRLATVGVTAALLVGSASVMVLGQQLEPGEVDPPHPAAIQAGTCDAPGDEVAALNDVVLGTDAAVGAASAIPVEVSAGNVEVSLDDILGAAHSIVVRDTAEAGQPIACGDIGGQMLGPDDLAIALLEASGSGHQGTARLHREGDTTTSVTVLLLTTAGTAAPGQPGASAVPGESVVPVMTEVPAGETTVPMTTTLPTETMGVVETLVPTLVPTTVPTIIAGETEVPLMTVVPSIVPTETTVPVETLVPTLVPTIVATTVPSQTTVPTVVPMETTVPVTTEVPVMTVVPSVVPSVVASVVPSVVPLTTTVPGATACPSPAPGASPGVSPVPCPTPAAPSASPVPAG